MQLQHFEAAFSKQILARGRDYYEEDAVENITQINETNWQAEVQGSELYIVDIVIDEAQNITYMDCDCPYEDNCKHMAAVLYCMTEGYTLAPVKATPSIKELLQQRTKEQLVELILTLSSKHSAFKKELELQLTPQENELEIAYNMIVHYAESAKGRSGFIEWGQAEAAVEGINLVHERIATHIEEGHIKMAVQLALLCVYQGMEMLEYGDDSDGEFGGAVEYSIELVQQALEASDQLDETQGLAILSQVADATEDEALQGWPDWQLDLLSACLPLCEYPACEQQLLRMMDELGQRHPEGRTNEYVQKRLQRMKQQIETTKLDDEQALVYLRQHPEDDELRQRLIDNALQSKDYALVIELAEQEEPRWQKFLFLAYQALGDTQKTRVLGEQLLLAGNGDYYAMLKGMYDAKEWSMKREQLLDQLERRSSYLYGRCIVEEKLTARILTFCQRNTYLIKDYYKHLVGVYDEETEAIFEEEILENALAATSRSQYNRVCGLIAIMQKAGYIDGATKLIDTLKQQNKRRPAFIDELNKIS